MDEKTMSEEKLLENIKGGKPVFLLDVRDEEKFKSGTLQAEGIETVNIPYVLMRDNDPGIKQLTDSLPRETEIITVCTTGNKAQKAAALLREKGYTARALEGGLTAWKEIKDNKK